MTYLELVEKVQKSLAAADVSGIAEHIAVQVNVTGEAGGAFYMEVADGTLTIAPYDYVDRDILLTADEADVLAFADGKLTLEQAVANGAVAFEGDYDKAVRLSAALAKKPAAKKTAAKKTTAKKTEAKAETGTACKRGRKSKTDAEAAQPAKTAEKKTRSTRKTTKKEA